MRIWHTTAQPDSDLQILQIGYEPVGEKAKWGPGRRNFYILHYVLSGRGYFNGTAVESGQGFLMRPMESVEYHPDPERPWNYFWLCFDGPAAPGICDRYIPADEKGIFTYNFPQAITRRISQLTTREPNLGNLYALAVFYGILAYHEEAPVGKNPYVDGAVAYIRANFHRPLSVEEVANTCGIDDRYLYNLFVKHLGVSPKQYLNKLRLDNAKQLLTNSDCAVTEVAFSVGFPDVLSFSRFFAKHTGMSPTSYRSRALQFDIL